MTTQRYYCPVCQRPVLLLEPSASAYDGQAPVANQAGPVCLDYREACAEGRCDPAGLPGALMGMRFAQHCDAVPPAGFEPAGDAH